MDEDITIRLALLGILCFLTFRAGAWYERKKIPQYEASIVSEKQCATRVEDVRSQLVESLFNDSELGKVVAALTGGADKEPLHWACVDYFDAIHNDYEYVGVSK